MVTRNNIYQDKIMGGLEGDPDPYNFNQLFNQSYTEPVGVPGMDKKAINFKDAPVNFMLRENNPALPFYKEPATNIKNIVQDFPGSIKSGIDKGIDFGKAAIGGIASLVSGIPGLGALLGAFGPMSPEDKAMKDFYGSEFGLTDTGQVASGIMAGYNPVSLFGGPGLSKSIDKRIATIQKTLKKKKSDTLQKRLQALEALRQKEEQARERDRAARARAANAAVYADLDRRTGGKGFGDAGGFSTARAGKEGAFGTFDGSRGRKDYSKGGIVNLL
jgi:hypothetical protein|tara:strand:- start:25 stop:846 length:822 start_codon:yes stop_codon:yes gene_type:complete